MIEQKEYEIELTTLEPIRIGGIANPLSGIDNPIALVGNEVVVPGSTLKGAYRCEIERYLIDTYLDRVAKKWSDKNLQPCIPSTKLSPDENQLVVNGLYRFYNLIPPKGGDIGDIKGEGCHYPCHGKCNELHEICPVCYFLGANGLEGFVKVPFLYAKTAVNELYSANIDRAIQTVKQGTNRPYQLVPDGIKFTGTLTVILKDTIRDRELGKARNLKEYTGGDAWLAKPRSRDDLIKEFIIDRFVNIKTIGGYKSKGFGKVDIKIKQK
ncbi:MAG: hypothetical protein WC556_06370 [Candidatus Methanoperedens sp.]